MPQPRYSFSVSTTKINVPEYPALVLMFGMDGCSHCEDFEPVLRAAHGRHSRVPAFVINCKDQGEIADALGVTGTPTTFLLSRGRVVARLEGAQSPEMSEMLFQKADAILAQERA